jgi:predicted dinucleotide-binding enzyme
LSAPAAAGAANLRGKVLIELGNPLEYSKGFPPRSLANDDSSLAEQIQQAFPDAKVVKTLNTMFAPVMVNPKLVPGDSTVFVCGNDDLAKATVSEILKDFGWTDILDLGDISSARALEMLLPLTLRNFGAIGHSNFNLKEVR